MENDFPIHGGLVIGEGGRMIGDLSGQVLCGSLYRQHKAAA